MVTDKPELEVNDKVSEKSTAMELLDVHKKVPGRCDEDSRVPFAEIPTGPHIESLEIPHLRIVRDSNHVSFTDQQIRPSRNIVKQEQDLLYDSDDDADYFDESSLKDLENLPLTDGINNGSNNEAESTEEDVRSFLNPLIPPDNSDEHSNFDDQIDTNQKSVLLAMPKSNSCSNCKAEIFDETSTCKNFHEFLPHQYLDITKGKHVDVQIIDALSEIFKIRWTCSSFGEIYKRKDLALCIGCASSLAQLYKMYNQFTTLSIKSNSFLSEVISFQKECRLERLEDKTSDVEGVLNYSSCGESEGQKNPNVTWKRTRHVKRVKRYVQEGDEENDESSSDNETRNTDFKILTKQHRKAKVLVTDSENENSYSETVQTNVPMKKRGNKKSDRYQTSEDETEFRVNKIDVDDSMSAFEVQQTDDNDDDEEDEGNTSLQLLLKKLNDSASKTDPEGTILNCPACKKDFKFPIQLRIHLSSKYHKDKMKMMKLGQEDIEDDASKKRIRKSPLRGSVSKVLKKKSSCCQECGKIFSKSKDLARHIKSHHDMKEEGKCDRCGKNFKTLGGLKIHYAAHVRDDNKYSCKDCGKKFRKSDALELHERTDHGGFKPFVCTICQKRFRLKDKLKLHIMVIHEKKKPFPCPKCEKSFRTKYHLKIHDVSQHIQGGDTSIGCSQCKRKFLDREALEKHLVVHEQEKPYVCSICGKGFHTSARLKLHEKSHQEVPSCLCPVCGRAYKHIRDLKLHEVVHQDESTYRFGCGDCSRRFYRIDLLRVHQSNEKHFSSEMIGPTVSKSLTSNKDVSYFQTKEDILDDDEDDENETDNDTPPPPPQPKAKRRKKQINPRERSNKLQSLPQRDREMTVMHPHTTVIYHPASMVQLHLDQSPICPTTPAVRNETSNQVNNINLTSHNQRYSHETPGTSSGSYIMNQRDFSKTNQSLHYSGIQIQPVPSSSHPHFQLANNTIYAMRDASGHSTLNVTTNTNGAEQIGFDIISSFMNNLS